MFVNTALLPFFINIVIKNAESYKAIFGTGGLAQYINYILIINIFTPNLVALLDIEYFIKNIKRSYYKKRGQFCVLTQQQLNNLYEDPEFKISQRYAVLLNTLFTTAFYSSILPFALIWGIFSVFFHYWTDKYTLLRRKVVKFNQSASLSVEMTE